MIFSRIERIAAVLSVGVASFGVYQYYDSQHQARVDRVARYFDEFHAGDLLEARKVLGGLSYQWLEARNPDGSAPTAEQFAARAMGDLSVPENLVRVDVVLEFFERARACVRTAGCDAEAAKRLLAPAAAEFVPIVSPLLRQQTGPAGRDSFGHGLLCFAGWSTVPDCFEPE